MSADTGELSSNQQELQKPNPYPLFEVQELIGGCVVWYSPEMGERLGEDKECFVQLDVDLRHFGGNFMHGTTEEKYAEWLRQANAICQRCLGLPRYEELGRCRKEIRERFLAAKRENKVPELIAELGVGFIPYEPKPEKPPEGTYDQRVEKLKKKVAEILRAVENGG